MYTTYPDYNKRWRFVLQVHLRGKSAHLDFRYEVKKDTLLLGWTLAAIKSISREPKDLKEAKKLVDEKMDELKKNLDDPNTKYIAIQKQPQPFPWLNVDHESFEKGILGATSEKRGYMFVLDKGTIEFGALKPHFWEYWLDSKNKLFHGRFVIRELQNIWKQQAIDEDEDIKTGKGHSVNMCWFADINNPYILSSRAVNKNWMPPNGVPALPKKIRDQIESNFHYWNYKDKKAVLIRKNLVTHNRRMKIEYK